MLNAVIFRTDLYTGIYGYRDKYQKVVCFNYKQLKKDTGLTPSQYYRCARILQEQGWLTIVPVTQELATGKTITVEVQIRINPDIFNLLGQGEQYGKDRHYKMMQAHKNVQGAKIIEAQARIMQQKNFTPRGARVVKPKKVMSIQELANSKNINAPKPYNVVMDQAMVRAAMDLSQQTGVSMSECLRSLKENYKPPPR